MSIQRIYQRSTASPTLKLNRFLKNANSNYTEEYRKSWGQVMQIVEMVPDIIENPGRFQTRFQPTEMFYQAVKSRTAARMI